MFFMLLISLVFGQTGGEPSSQMNSVKNWCHTNAILKDQLVKKGGCVWAMQDKAYALPTVSGKRYICGRYPGGKTPTGYEGQLSCPDPFGNLDKDGNPLMIVYQCATCFSNNNTFGVLEYPRDIDCMDSMRAKEEHYCDQNSGDMMYFHDIDGLKQKAGGPAPTPAMQDPVGTPELPPPPITP